MFYTTVTYVLVLTSLDYCNVFLMGLPLKTTWKLQLVQNSAAQLLISLYGCKHIFLSHVGAESERHHFSVTMPMLQHFLEITLGPTILVFRMLLKLSFLQRAYKKCRGVLNCVIIFIFILALAKVLNFIFIHGYFRV